MKDDCCDQFKYLEIWGMGTEQPYLVHDDFDDIARTIPANFCPNCGMKIKKKNLK